MKTQNKIFLGFLLQISEVIPVAAGGQIFQVFFKIALLH
jgi:hypothetical protein